MMAVFVLGAIVTTLMTGPLFDHFAPPRPAEPVMKANEALAQLGPEVEDESV